MAESSAEEGAGQTPAPSHLGGILSALCLFATWWGVVQAFALIAFFRLRLTEPDAAYTWTSQIRGMLPLAWQGFAAMHARFDSGFYQLIALGGYNADTAAFMPLYPLLVRVVTEAFCGWFRCSAIDGAFVVSNLSAAGASLAIFRLARLDGSGRFALRALWYFLLFPTSFFLTANYTESTFILFAALSFLAARQGQWARAGLWGAGAMLTRAAGLALGGALLVEWWTQREGPERSWLWLLQIPAAFAAFQAYLSVLGLSFFDTQYRLFRRAPWNFDSVPDNLDWIHLTSQPAAQVNLGLDVGLALLVVGASLGLMARGRASYGVYGVLCILLPLSSGQTLGLSRFALAAFTVPLALAQLGRHVWIDRAYTLAGTLLLALCTLLFVQGYWAG